LIAIKSNPLKGINKLMIKNT